MNLADLRESLSEEMRAVMAPEFRVLPIETTSAPNLEDPCITYANLDAREMKCRTIETCVLHIDIRQSTKLTLKHQLSTLAKLYSCFVRMMARCGSYYGGQVRSIAGDRLMVVFDAEECFPKAINTAVLMNSVSRFVLNTNYPRNKVRCGIGIDYGKMFVIKAGVRRAGQDNADYKSLVWLGRPANIASKLTDAANQTYGGTCGAPSPPTPPILVTESVWKGYVRFRSANATGQVGKWCSIGIGVPGYFGKIHGGNILNRVFIPRKQPPPKVVPKDPRLRWR